MPDLKDLVQRVAVATGKTVHVRGQWDNAGPHIEKKLIRLIAVLFGEFGWD